MPKKGTSKPSGWTCKCSQQPEYILMCPRCGKSRPK